MRKGASLERSVTKLFEHYKQKGIYCQQCHPRTLPDGKVVGKHGFDFFVLHDRLLTAFDAKECVGDRWSLKNAKTHQTDALLSISRNGGDGFYMVWFFKYKQLIKFPAEYVLNCGKKSLTPSDGEQIKLDFLGVL